jgi:hypothetical protein
MLLAARREPMSRENPPVLANIENHKKFIGLYPKFCDALPAIVELTDRVTTQPGIEDADQDRKLANILMVELGALSFEDFDQVVLPVRTDIREGV